MAKKKSKPRPRRKPAKKPTLLVDADIVLYQVCLEQLQEEREPDGTWTWRLSEEGAASEFCNRVDDLTRESGCGEATLCFGAAGNWRKVHVSRDYKSNRDGKKKPLGYYGVQNALFLKYKTISLDWLEADDVIGIEATREGADVVVCSADKDMKQVPGRHYHPTAQEHSVVTHDEADAWHMIQTLAGDPTDGYSGCPGTGVKRAGELIAATPRRGWWRAVVEKFAEVGMSEREALRQARLARILRHGEYDPPTGKVTLWKPPRVAVKKKAAKRGGR